MLQMVHTTPPAKAPQSTRRLLIAAITPPHATRFYLIPTNPGSTVPEVSQFHLNRPDSSPRRTLPNKCALPNKHCIGESVRESALYHSGADLLVGPAHLQQPRRVVMPCSRIVRNPIRSLSGLPPQSERSQSSQIQTVHGESCSDPGQGGAIQS